jgi:hypothetical protein
MDLSFSPDLNAFCCYGVVLICAFIAARFQVYRRLSENKIYGIWLEPSTWVMFGIYLVTPLVLFWLMDRVGALHDTSLFAALLVGCAYPAILAGGFGGLKAPEGLTGIWKPIEAFTDALVKRVLEQSSLRDKRFEDFIVGEMLADNEKFSNILKFVQNRTDASSRLSSDLSAIEAAVQPPPAGVSMDPEFAREKKARLIYLYLSSLRDYQSLLRVKNLVPNSLFKSPLEFLRYLWNSPLYRNRIVSSFITVILLASIAVATVAAFRWTPMGISYYQWRLVKANNTDLDRFRAHEHLHDYLLSGQPKTVAQVRKALTHILLSPGLKPESVDLSLRLLLESRTDLKQDTREVADLLVPALRVDSVDSRGRIHQVLVLMAVEQEPSFDKSELATWNPIKSGDSVASLERRIRLWDRHWHPEKFPATQAS